ncbi:uncharacterized protein LOC131687875 [Topomyia yanbarensis]|uniref:uncharacterized protein LOC131687875 n=1 Tax=Topomyia yanbarensis TaxID=2498891 RepID=UPI00273A7D7D|nr:uncharacterized protein LOC131687875 [Topomyia yanbarensis]
MFIAAGILITVAKITYAFIKHILDNFFIRFWPGIERPIVEVRQGKVKGVTDKLPNGGKYHFFKGIPYAKPPVGELRFRSPQALERFNKPELNCCSDKGFIRQSMIVTDWPAIGTEDGLYLNIYTPSLPSAERTVKSPVMVYIHGGAFRYGTASSVLYDPKHLVQQGVVVVTMFYRLGPLGFLCLPNAGISGNAGLKDQRLALQWVHEQIHQFGGDAENVTLFGESAGSWSTYLHYLSPNSRKYFHRVICQSGDACTEMAFQVDPEEKARGLARILGYNGNSDQEVLATLMKATAGSLLNHQNDVISPSEQSCPHRFLFRPVIERQFSEDSIITQTPEEILKRYDTIRMPIISGCNSAEGALALFLSKCRLNEYNQHPEWLVPRFIRTPQGWDRRNLGLQVKQFYLGKRDLGWDTTKETCDLMSDLTYLTSSNLSLEWIAKYQPNAPHYHYLFDYRGRLSYVEMSLKLGLENGAYHGDDVFYMFSPSLLPLLPANSDECRVRDLFVRFFTNFAKYGNPTPYESSQGVTWTPVRPVERSSASFDIDCLHINQSPQMIRNHYGERKEFWRSLIINHTNLFLLMLEIKSDAYDADKHNSVESYWSQSKVACRRAGSKIMLNLVLLLVRFAIALVRKYFEDVYIQHWPGLVRPIVKVRQGKLQGVTSKLPNGAQYHFFKGIPYAKPPTGELRFCSPVPLERFTKPVIKCLIDKSEFIQPHEIFGNYWIVGTEDALYLNVYTPELPAAEMKKYPVMVYIHGGGLKRGTASSFIYDPRYFVQKGVIVVVMSYRLGPFGFLSIPSAGVSGNFGLKDQRLALKWVQENIECFGGNPENVTLFGESAGSWSTYLHYLSANSRKYFHRVICQSGDSCTESALQVEPTEKARRLARYLGYKGDSDQEALDILRRAPARRLLKYQDAVISEQEKGLPLKFLFRPVIELELGEDTILSQSPESTLKSFDTIQMPIIQGYTSGEGILALSFNKYNLKQFDLHPEWLIPQHLGDPVDLNKTATGEKIKQFYCKRKPISWEATNEIRDLFSDLTFLTTSNLSAEWLAKFQPNATQYHYLFSYDGRLSLVKRLLNMSHIEGTSHADDCLYMFSPPFLPALPADSDEVRVREILVELWTNFAKHNDPTPETSRLSFKWLPVTKTDPKMTSFDLDCLEINVRPRMVRNPFPERIEFWRNLMKRYTNLI